MSNVPEGAQLSEDGHWWWDGDQWQPVQQNTADGDAAGGDGAPDERATARVAEGLPPSLYDITDEQRAKYVAEPTVTVEAVEHDEVEVLAMEDAGHGSGEATA